MARMKDTGIIYHSKHSDPFTAQIYYDFRGEWNLFNLVAFPVCQSPRLRELQSR